MSSLIVEVCKVDQVEKHPNADALDIVTVKGWQTCTKIGEFKVGDPCIYFPPDHCIPGYVADGFNVKKYLSRVSDNDGLYRIRASSLRGVKSYGLIVKPVESMNWTVGQDVSGYYGVQKYIDPSETDHSNIGDAEKFCKKFHKYTDIENLKNYKNIFSEGENVYITEKIHGQNCRFGYLLQKTKQLKKRNKSRQ